MRRISAFTLVELIITVSILSVGIVFVIRSFLSVSSALSYAKHRIKAVYAAEDVVNVWQQKALEDAGLKDATAESQKVLLDVKDADCNIEIVPLEDGTKNLMLFSAVLSWKEGERGKDAGVWTYFSGKE